MDDDSRKQLAKRAFNGAWDLIDKAQRDAEEERRMLVLACASRFLWEEVGGPEELMTGDWQVAHVLSHLGAGDVALLFASATLATAEEQGWNDWHLASCLEGMARAHAARGDKVERDRYVAASTAMLTGLEHDDREIIEAQINSVPVVE